MGLHEYTLKKIPGRPYIDNEKGLITARDPIIKKYTCIYCDNTFFKGLDGDRNSPTNRKIRQSVRRNYRPRRR